MSIKLPVFPCTVATGVLSPVSVETVDLFVHVKYKESGGIWDDFYIVFDKDIFKFVSPVSVLI